MAIYYCKECDGYFSDNQIDEKEICYEEEYGVLGLFPDRTYANVSCCPHCGGTDYDEEDEDEIADLLNYYTRKKVVK